MASFASFFISLISVAVVLGVLIVLHEFGHFAAAKLFGVRVEQFAVGFGKRLFGVRRGETDYRVNLLPLGGYVKMSGENPLEARTGDPREFMSHPRWHRFVIALAGPAMNLLLAVGLLAGVFMVRYEHLAFLEEPVKVGWVLEHSPAEKAGIQPGDTIVRIENIQNPTWQDALYRIALNPGQPLDVAFQRGNEVITKKLVPEKAGKDEIGTAGLLPAQRITVDAMDKNMPAQQAGIQVGDEVVALNGVPLHSVEGLLRRLKENGETPAEVTVVRHGAEVKFKLQPVKTELDGKTLYRIGISTAPAVKVDKLPFVPALRRSVSENWKNSALVLELVEKMIERKVSMKQMSGPIGIARATGQAVSEPGWTSVLMLMSTISLQLGIFNLFPIPILDGGIILLLLVESLIRRDISMQVKERLYQAAFVFLVLFAAVVIYNDIAKL